MKSQRKIQIKSSLNAIGRPLMGTIQGFADVATWMIGAIIFVPMLIIEYRKIYKQYGFKML